RRDPLLGTIVKLVRNNKFEWLVFFLQRADSRNRKDALDTKLFESIDIGTEIEFSRKNAMPATVPRQESDFAPLKRSYGIGVRRLAERCVHGLFMHICQSRHGIQATPANDPY